MEALNNMVSSLIGQEVDMTSFLILALVLTVSSLVFGFIGRFALYERQTLMGSMLIAFFLPPTGEVRKV